MSGRGGYSHAAAASGVQWPSDHCVDGCRCMRVSAGQCNWRQHPYLPKSMGGGENPAWLTTSFCRYGQRCKDLTTGKCRFVHPTQDEVAVQEHEWAEYSAATASGNFAAALAVGGVVAPALMMPVVQQAPVELTVDLWDPYNSVRVRPLPEPAAATATSATAAATATASIVGNKYAVMSNGFLCDADQRRPHVCMISPQALEVLAAVAEQERVSDSWKTDAPEYSRLRNFLNYTWIRLLEQGRVLYCQDASAPAATSWRATTAAREPTLVQLGVTREFILFNTCLVDSSGRDVIVMLVRRQADSQREAQYVLLSSGVLSQEAVQALRDLLRKDGALVCKGDRGLLRAEYVVPCDPRLLLNWTLRVDTNEHHIVVERLDRLIEAGVVDSIEAMDAPRADDADGSRTRPTRFARGEMGERAVSRQMRAWIDESLRLVKSSFTLAVPQYYYTLEREPSETGSASRSVFTGHLQLLLPLYCGRPKPVLALALELMSGSDGDSHYLATTVLTLPMAYSNARLLVAPQVAWLR